MDDYFITSLFTFESSPSQDCVEVDLLEDSCVEGQHSFTVSLEEPEQPSFATAGLTNILIIDANDGIIMPYMIQWHSLLTAASILMSLLSSDLFQISSCPLKVSLLKQLKETKMFKCV